MLLERVRAHNRVYGFRFIAVEFGAIVLVLAPFAIYYWAAGRWTLALVATGIIANCLPIVYQAVRSLRAREPGPGRLRERMRARLGSDQRHVDNDTVAIAVCTLVPFLGAALMTANLLSLRRPPGQS